MGGISDWCLCGPPGASILWPAMQLHSIFAKCLLAATVAALLTGCLTRRTVTASDGRTIESKYVVERPVKKLINNSQ